MTADSSPLTSLICIALTVAWLVLLIRVLVSWLARTITRPLKEAVVVAQKVASGDLTSAIEVKSGDETGLLLQSLKDMNNSLEKIVHQVRRGTDSISSASQDFTSPSTGSLSGNQLIRASVSFADIIAANIHFRPSAELVCAPCDHGDKHSQAGRARNHDRGPPQARCQP